MGPLVAGALAEWAPAPRQLCFLVTLGVTVVAAAFALGLPDPVQRGREAWRIQWPRVPRRIRTDFARVSLTAATGWGTLALYLSIVPSYARSELGTHDLALVGAIAAAVLAASCVSQIVSRRRRESPRRDQAIGLLALALGLALLVAASPLGSLAVLLASAVAAGAGHGLSFLDAQDELNRIAPGERRGEVTAAFICSIYLVVGGSVIATGLLDREISLSLSIGAVSAVLGVVALLAAGWQWEPIDLTHQGRVIGGLRTVASPAR